MRTIKATQLKQWIEEEIRYSTNPEQVVVNYYQPLSLGGRKIEGQQVFAPNAELISEAINQHGNESVHVGGIDHYQTQDEAYLWTLSFDVYMDKLIISYCRNETLQDAK